MFIKFIFLLGIIAYLYLMHLKVLQLQIQYVFRTRDHEYYRIFLVYLSFLLYLVYSLRHLMIYLGSILLLEGLSFLLIIFFYIKF